MAFIDQGEFEAVKTLSGWEAARCDEHPYRAKIKVSACSGVARTSPLLGHSMVPGAKCRSLWGLGASSPENLEKFYSLPGRFWGQYRSEVYVTYGKLAYDERMRLIIWCDTAPFDFKTF